ncbi:hypothetical protein M569_05603, partial [Genlisea aurea]
ENLTAQQSPPTQVQRRPRVREVSSRFMTPLVHSNQTPKPSDFPRSKSAGRQQSLRIDENHIPNLDKSGSVSSPGRIKHLNLRFKNSLKESGEVKENQCYESRFQLKPGTPIPTATNRTVQSRYRKAPKAIQRSNSMPGNTDGPASVSEATRLLQEGTSALEKKIIRASKSNADDSECFIPNLSSFWCPDSPMCAPSTKLRTTPVVRSSMPDVEKLLAERNPGQKTGDCARSLNFSTSGKPSLPPHPSSCIRSGLDAKKGKKFSNHMEDVHCLKMLSNHYLQWRFANSKATASMHSQTQGVEIRLCSLEKKISGMRENVKQKRKELATLRRIQTLNEIVESQIRYLDEWDGLEEDYTSCLSAMTNGLLNTLVRMPVTCEVRADPEQLTEAMASAVNVMESIRSQILRFTDRAEEIDKCASELARTAGEETGLIQDCGYLVASSHSAQVKELSLRSSLIQISSNSDDNHQNR